MIDSYKQSMIDLKKEAIKDGFDGFYFKGSVPEHDIYVAFYADQIRSSITLNENITYYTDHGDYLAHWMIAVFIFMLLHLVYFKLIKKN